MFYTAIQLLLSYDQLGFFNMTGYFLLWSFHKMQITNCWYCNQKLFYKSDDSKLTEQLKKIYFAIVDALFYNCTYTLHLQFYIHFIVFVIISYWCILWRKTENGPCPSFSVSLVHWRDTPGWPACPDTPGTPAEKVCWECQVYRIFFNDEST